MDGRVDAMISRAPAIARLSAQYATLQRRAHQDRLQFLQTENASQANSVWDAVQASQARRACAECAASASSIDEAHSFERSLRQIRSLGGATLESAAGHGLTHAADVKAEADARAVLHSAADSELHRLRFGFVDMSGHVIFKEIDERGKLVYRVRRTHESTRGTTRRPSRLNEDDGLLAANGAKPGRHSEDGLWC